MSVPSRQRTAPRGQSALRLALFLTVVMMVVEAVFGWLSGSLALLADAGHMFTDASGLGLSLFAAWFASRPANVEKTYGYYRTEILAALANGVALCLIVAWIYVRALERLEHPSAIHGQSMMTVAVIGLAVNLFCGLVLGRERGTSLNLQGAWLNVMSDALGSLGVLVAGACLMWFGWKAADPIASMVIGILIAINSWNLITQAVNILLEGTPGHVRVADVVQAMRELPGIREVHDIHLWTITTGMDAMSGHVVVEDIGNSSETLSRLTALLSQRFGIAHTTFQLEPDRHECRSDDTTCQG